MDSSSATELLNALYEANKELHTTILMVTHDAYAASFADRFYEQSIYYCKHGCFYLFGNLCYGSVKCPVFFKTSLMDLVRFEKSAERRMKFRKIPALFGVIFIMVGYGLALDIFRGAGSIWFSVGFYPTGQLPVEYSAGTSKGSADNEKIAREAGFECISYSQYSSLLQAQNRNEIIRKLSKLRDAFP